MKRACLGFVALTVAVVSMPSSASAQWSPSRPVTILVGYEAGGGADTLARIVADDIKARLGWTVIVENRPGVGGAMMLSQLARSEPDGYRVGLSPTSSLMAPVLNKAVQFRIDDFTYLGTVAKTQNAMIARADAPFDNLAQLVTFARQKGHATVATLSQEMSLVGRLIARHYGVELTMVPTKGGSEAITLLLGNQVDAAFNAGAHQPYVEQGQLKVIANLNATPLVQRPEARNLKSYGIDYEAHQYFQIQGPKGMAESVRNAWEKAVESAVKSKAVSDVAAQRLMLELQHLGPDDLKKLVEAELARQTALIATTR